MFIHAPDEDDHEAEQEEDAEEGADAACHARRRSNANAIESKW